MNITLPEKEKINKKTMTIYIVALIICIIAIVVVIGVQILGDDVINNLFGINKLVKRTDQEEAELKANFENIFDNELENNKNYQTQKIDNNKDIVYTNYSKEDKTDKYEINVNLPYINIKNKSVQNFNNEIENIFQAKSEEIIKNADKKVIYTVKYKANIENDILSLIIYSDLKQDLSAQRIIIQTFNYNLEDNKELSLDDILKIYDLNKNNVQNKIDKDIKAEQKKSEDLIGLGYNVFSRDLKSEIYKVENIKEYFIYNNNIYIIFAYGNEKITTEKDIVII
jgi:hypothetical protein